MAHSLGVLSVMNGPNCSGPVMRDCNVIWVPSRARLLTHGQKQREKEGGGTPLFPLRACLQYIQGSPARLRFSVFTTSQKHHLEDQAFSLRLWEFQYPSHRRWGKDVHGDARTVKMQRIEVPYIGTKFMSTETKPESPEPFKMSSPCHTSRYYTVILQSTHLCRVEVIYPTLLTWPTVRSL